MIHLPVRVILPYSSPLLPLSSAPPPPPLPTPPPPSFPPNMYPPSHTIYVLPDILSAAPHSDTASILYESWCIGLCCSSVGVHTSPPPPGLLLTPPPPKAGYPIAPMYRVAVSSPPNVIPPCGGILWRSAWSEWSSLRYPILTRGYPVQPPYKNFQSSGSLPPSSPKSWTCYPTSAGPSSNWTLLPAIHRLLFIYIRICPLLFLFLLIFLSTDLISSCLRCG